MVAENRWEVYLYKCDKKRNIIKFLVEKMKAKTKQDLTPVQMDTLNTIFQTCILMQISLHKLENVSDSVIFVRQNKQQLTKTLKWLESIVETLTLQLDVNESEEYVALVSQLEKLSNEIKLSNE
jgi:hypothetical protein